MSEDYKFQVSVKFGTYDQSMLNVRAESASELDVLLQAVNRMAGTITVAADTLRATALEDQPPNPGVGTQTNAVRQGVQQQQQPGHPVCAHGQMVKVGPRTNEDGTTWTGYYCALGRDNPNRCKPQYDRG